VIVLLDTSTPVCRLTFVDNDSRQTVEWQADRQLAKGLHAWMNECLNQRHQTWTDIAALGVFKGPGSFTGLRIGLTVMNTLAESLGVPIVGVQGDDWQNSALARLDARENDRIVLPDYGSDAHITMPKK